nr:MAG TPA: hypothetical protein [Caudoviricetes sp.]
MHVSISIITIMLYYLYFKITPGNTKIIRYRKEYLIYERFISYYCGRSDRRRYI